ncbi:hypothetical protein ACLMAL_21650 [Nocardia sp. CWNU-33]|uniref:hypothetical protein n=1 Tax=Nocardia sp. CWNU-33 TaxID=3392117 RepID=UPI00398F6037
MGRPPFHDLEFLPQILKMKTVAVAQIVPDAAGSGERTQSSVPDCLAGFRCSFYDSLAERPDVLFELADAVLCAEGPVTTLVGLSLTPEYRRSHGGLYHGLAAGEIRIERLCRPSVGLDPDRHLRQLGVLAMKVGNDLVNLAIPARLLAAWPVSWSARQGPSPRCRGGVDVERGAGIAPGPFLHAALPNRTCELSPHPALHKSR